MRTVETKTIQWGELIQYLVSPSKGPLTIHADPINIVIFNVCVRKAAKHIPRFNCKRRMERVFSTALYVVSAHWHCFQCAFVYVSSEYHNPRVWHWYVNCVIKDQHQSRTVFPASSLTHKAILSNIVKCLAALKHSPLPNKIVSLMFVNRSWKYVLPTCKFNCNLHFNILICRLVLPT